MIGGALIGMCLAALVPGFRVLASSQTFSGKVELDPLPQRTTVYAADGKTVIGQLGLEDRSVASLDEIPKVTVNAIVAMEDKTFWDNPGVDFEGTARALLSNLSSGGVVQGGSTITQQLVKNRILTPKRDLQRKLREMILAVRLNNQYSKQQILREYLNTVYFGEGSYGIKSAAERFFQKDVSQLTLPESALLAAVVSSPTYYDPFVYPDHAKQRRTIVLRRMVEQKYITQAEADAADAVPLPTVKPASGGLRPENYFVQEVQDRLLGDDRLGATPQERYTKVLRGGLKVYTTYDARMYFLAQTAVNQILPKQPPFTAALASMDPQNGEVKAIVGGPGLNEFKYNLVTHPPGRQPGSTYKVITLATAIENGYSLNDMVDGSSPCTVSAPGFGTYPNARNAEPGGGVMTLRAALVGSVNCAFVRLNAAVGPDKVARMAVRLGIRNEPPHYLSITLGTVEATPLEMATVMSTLADDGVRHDPIFIRKVVGPTGELLFDNKSQGQRVIDPQVARTVIDAMKGVITGGTGTGARLPDGRVAAGKTGTTDQETDAWFDGFTPQLVTVVWMGDPAKKTPMKRVGGRTVFGGTYPASIWRAFMSGALSGQPNLDFFPPDRSKWPSPRGVLPGKGRGALALPPPTTTTLPPGLDTSTTAPGTTTSTTAPGTTTTTAPTTTAPPTTAPPTTAPPTTAATLPAP